MLAQGHDKLSVYGIAASDSRDELRDRVEDLKREGLLSVSDGEFPTLSVTSRGREFLRGRETLTLSRPAGRQGAADSGRGGAADDYDAGLYSALAALRREIADERGVPAYVIFGNRALQDMARRVPRTSAEFARVSGVGRAKLEDLGGPFLERINAYASEHGWPEPSAAVGKNARAAKEPRVVNQSFRETGRLISEGASLEEAADARGLTVTTILGHLERLMEEDIAVEWGHLLPAADQRADIEAVFEIVGDELLRPVFDELNGRYSYNEIRLTRLAKRCGEGCVGPEPSAGVQRDPRSMMGRG